MCRFFVVFAVCAASLISLDKGIAQEKKPASDPIGDEYRWREAAAFGNPARTIDELTADIRIDPANPLLFKLRAIRWMLDDDNRAGETTRMKIAIKDFTESLRLWPLQPEVYLLRGIARYEIAFTAESCQDAIDDFDSALRFEDKPAGLAAWA